MDVTIKNNDEHYYVTHGVTPELMSPIAYRRVGKPKLIAWKIIKCPICRGTLTQVDRNTKVKIYRLPKGKMKRKYISGLFIKHCSKCKEAVGLIMAS